MYINHGSNTQVRKTTKGWPLCVEWKDGTTSWEHLADLKESEQKATQLKLMSMQLQRACMMPLLLFGGIHMFSRIAAELMLL
jgi:phosphoribosylformimino-5-aminoimidazole carboxamide ribonucleotide (ProFAR) isomerase